MTSSDRVLAQRYSQALCQAAEAAGKLGEVCQELEEAHKTLRGARGVFLHPLIPVAAKKNKLREVVGRGVSPLTLQALDLLLEKKRFYLLPGMLQRIQEILDEKMGVRKAQVRTAFPLSEAEERGLKERLVAATGKEVVMQVKEDPSLIGGLVVRVGDWMMDASFSSALGRLREKLGNVGNY